MTTKKSPAAPASANGVEITAREAADDSQPQKTDFVNSMDEDEPSFMAAEPLGLLCGDDACDVLPLEKLDVLSSTHWADTLAAGVEPKPPRVIVKAGEVVRVRLLPAAYESDSGKFSCVVRLATHHWLGRFSVSCPRHTCRVLGGGGPCAVCDSGHEPKCYWVWQAVVRERNGVAVPDHRQHMAYLQLNGTALARLQPRIASVLSTQSGCDLLLTRNSHGAVEVEFCDPSPFDPSPFRRWFRVLPLTWPPLPHRLESFAEANRAFQLSGSKKPEQGRAVRLIKLLGSEAVLVPVGYGSKDLLQKGYLTTDGEAMQDASYLERLDNSNIALLNGPGNIVTIDGDTEECYEQLQLKNPKLRQTTRRRGSRGGVFVIRVVGDFDPTVRKIVNAAGEACGELRCALITILSGLHPCGKEYQLEEAAPVEMRIDELVWPDGLRLKEAEARKESGGEAQAADGVVRLDFNKLECVVRRKDGWQARCPACAEDGKDKTGVHLWIGVDGRYGCAAHQGDGEHRREIWELAGMKRGFNALEEYSAIEADAEVEISPAAAAAAPDDNPTVIDVPSTTTNVVSDSKPKPVLPTIWMARRFPTLASRHGPAFRLEQPKDGQIYVAGLNEDFIANVMSEPANPDEPMVFVRAEKSFYAYRPEHGIFEMASDALVETYLSDILRLCAMECGSVCDTTPIMFRLRGKKSLRDVVGRAKGWSQVDTGYFERDGRELVACHNGMLRLSDRQLLPFAPSYRRRSKLAVPFDPHAKCPQFINILLKRGLRDEDIDVIQRYCGQILTGKNWAQKLLILKGQGGDGKGALARIIIGIIGAINAGYIRANKLYERFELSALHGKVLAFDGDAAADFLSCRGANVLKAITGGDQTNFEFKGANERPSQQLCLPVLVCANNKLRVKVEGDVRAWQRRLIYIEFKSEPLDEADVRPDLSAELLRDEGTGILNWMLDGLDKLRADGWKIHLTAAQELARDALLAESTSYVAFAREGLVPCRGASITVTESYDYYVDFCAARDWQPLTRTQFGRYIEEAVLQAHGTTVRNDILRRKTDGDKEQKGWMGLRAAADPKFTPAELEGEAP